MIRISVVHSDESVTVRAIGHSGLAEHGKDVLCAAVSALVQASYLSVAKHTDKVSYKRDKDTGLFEYTSCETDPDKRHDIDVVVDTLLTGLKDLQRGYPRNIKLEVA